MAEIKQIKEILSCDEIVKEELLILLKIEAQHINIQEIIEASLFLISDSVYVQENYRRRMIEAYTSGFITRIKEVKEHNPKDETLLDVEEVKEAVDLLLNQEEEASKRDDFNPAFSRIYKIISLYTTFIMDEPIHPVGTPFPGGFEVTFDGRKYLCPVKEKQKDNPGAVCGFCIAEQDPAV
jgi:uncharacterized protein (UPF0305 family)